MAFSTIRRRGSASEWCRRIVYVTTAYAAIVSHVGAYASNLREEVQPRNVQQLELKDYGLWKRIDSSALSMDGEWVAYTLIQESGEGELVVRHTRSSREFRVSRGRWPAPRVRVAGVPIVDEAQVSLDSRFVLFTIRSREPAGSTLGIMRLPDGELTKVSSVSTFVLPKESGRYVAYLVDAESESGRQAAAASSFPKKDLVVLELMSNRKVEIPDVSSFAFDPKANHLAYAISSDREWRNGVYIRRLTDGRINSLLTGSLECPYLTFDESGKRVAFIAEIDEPKRSTRRHAVYYSSSPIRAASSTLVPLPDGIAVSSGGEVRFSSAGDALIFNVVEAPSQPPSANSTGDKKVELWHWAEQDPRLQAHSRTISAGQSYLAVYHMNTKRFVQLADPSVPEVIFSDHARYAVGVDSAPYKLSELWRGPKNVVDLYLIDANTGERSLLRRKFQRSAGELAVFSPNGRYLIYFENRRWMSYDLYKEMAIDLTGRLLPRVSFDFMEGVTKEPVGIAGWAPGGMLLAYDSNDIWEIDPSGKKAPRNLTMGIGRKQSIIFRLAEDSPYSSIGTEKRSYPMLDTARPLLLSALDTRTMSSGIWSMRIGGSQVQTEKLYAPNKRVALVAKSVEKEQYLVTEQTFMEFPDLWVGARFDALRKISDANPQQIDYHWGTAELVEFVSEFGAPLKGVLYKPERFEPSKKYPMIVDIYELSASTLHDYIVPEALAVSNASTAIPSLLSQGYIVFRPDIFPAVPYPGQSAIASLRPAIERVIERGFVDRARIGLTGHSFGGFEAAYAITHTNLFRCASIGAAVSDTISAYTSVVALNKPNYYEGGQGRHGASVWEDPFTYFINSPLLFADRIDIPLLIMHNDRDVNVPFSQGTAFFSALRRLGKEAYLVNYTGEPHMLLSDENRLDWDSRFKQFFDHCLNDAPAPEWMAHRAAGQIIQGDLN